MLPQRYQFRNLWLNLRTSTTALVDSAKCLLKLLVLLKVAKMSSGIHTNEILFIYLSDVYLSNGCFFNFLEHFLYRWTFSPQKNIYIIVNNRKKAFT